MPLVGEHANEIIETVALLLHIGVMLVFLLIVLHSKHLHIGLAPVNVTFKRLPNALGPLLPDGVQRRVHRLRGSRRGRGARSRQDRGLHLEGLPRLHDVYRVRPLPVAVPGLEHRKAVVSQARHHEPARPPVRQGALHPRRQGDPAGEHRPRAASAKTCAARSTPTSTTHVPESGFERILGSGPEQATRPLVGTLEQGGVIDPDVLWSCTNCGACVEQCPVDIEHIDHIVDMRRYQVMVESEFPAELNGLFKNLERNGNPWGQSAKERTKWIDEVDFDVPGLRRGRRLLRRLRVPVLGRLRRRPRGPRQEDHQGRRRTARRPRA